MIKDRFWPMNKIKTFTGLRFLAAFFVFLYHINLTSRTPLTYLPDQLIALISKGNLGVTLFFALSGFVLVYANLADFPDGKFKSKAYYLKFLYKRLARIYPIYFCGLILTIFISLYFQIFPPYKILFLSIALIQTFIPELAMKWYDAAAWSVVNEIFFYGLFPFLFPILNILSKRNIFLTLTLLLITILTSFILGAAKAGLIKSPFPNFPFGWLYFYPPFRLPDFVVGMLAGILAFRYNVKISGWVALFFSILITWYLIEFGPILYGTFVHNWLVLPTYAIWLLALSQPKQIVFFKWLESKPMQYLGQISYSFYIFQIPIILSLDELIKLGKISQTNWFVLPITFIINLIGAIILHEGIEKKVHKILLHAFNKRINKVEEIELVKP